MISKLKYTCGTIYPSGCVIYTGEIPEFIEADQVSCDANIDEILKLAFDKLNDLLKSNDFSTLDKKCLDFDKTTVKAFELHQLEIDKLCDHETRITTLEGDLDALNIGSKLLTVDLKCLTPQAAPCMVSPSVYSLISIINVLVNEICEIKSQLNS